MKEKIIIVDFDLFYEAIKSIAKFAISSKFILNEDGLKIYSKNDFARCEFETNSIYTKNPIEISILEINMLLKLLTTIKDIHDNDYSELNFYIEANAIIFKSKKFKSKLVTCKEELIEKWVSKKITSSLNPVFEFTTTSELIKRLNSHSFIFSDKTSLRIYLKSISDMENNALFAELGNNTNLANSITLKFGLITFGSLGDRNIILDFERLNIFNLIQSSNIKISLMDKNVLVSNISIDGKHNTNFKLNIYNSIRKN